MRIFAAFTVLFLSACSFLQTAPETPPTPPAPPEVTQEMPTMDDSEEPEMMMHTAALSEDCESLKAKSPAEKTQILKDIAHNMDKDALDMILGKKCAFIETVEIADIEEDDLKLNPADTEILYFSAETNHFFVTCSSMNTIGYVVERLEEEDAPDLYFAEEEHIDEFRSAAKMAKDMMDSMGAEMEDMEMMDEEMDEMMDEDDMDMMEDEEMDDDVSGGAYINARDNVALASAAIGKGEPTVLFFHASWCAFCKVKDDILTRLYGDGSYEVSTYKVDFDTAHALKAQFGVTSQDTLVLIGPDGKIVETIIGGTEADIRRLIST